ncbi:MAG TPA: anhydro-N-acetylmuramic acid kinase [Fimbriimonadaceae bacterium]|nr:anhydro-N-acetylmuramic acid kinase [Fimbriimonadaceae bacterium]
MSGTSMDAIDVAICEIKGAGPGARVHLRSFRSFDYSPELASRLRNLESTVRELAEVNILVAEEFALAVAAASEELGLDLVGSHGQTVYHYSSMPGALKATLQVGDGDVIAERLAIPVVSDFRMGDIAAGGEGAPLTPYADFVLFGARPGLAVLNLGGIANLTILDRELSDVTGYDTGPANAPLDWIARAEFGIAFDRDGEIARSGEPRPGLVEELVRADAFVAQTPPKSTGSEVYGALFVERLREHSGASGADLLRLATEFVVASIACQVPPHVQELVLAGGGSANRFLRELLESRLPDRKVAVSDDHGIPFRAREAMAFAILANDTVCGLATSLPAVTGARRTRALGKLSLP